MTDGRPTDPVQVVATRASDDVSEAPASPVKPETVQSSPGERSRARRSVANAARSTAARMRGTATRLDVLAERLASTAGQQMGASGESEFVSAGRRAPGPRQR